MYDYNIHFGRKSLLHMNHTALFRLTCYTALVFLNILSVFINSANLNYILGLLVIICIALSFSGAFPMFKLFSSFFIISSCIFYSMTSIALIEIPHYMASTVPLISLLYVLPFINNIFRVGRYEGNINQLLKFQIRNMGEMYYRVSLANYLMCLFLFVAALPLVYNSYKKSLTGLSVRLGHQFSSNVLLRGFALAMVWSPIEILVALSVELTETSYLSVLPWLLLLSIVYILVDWSFGYIRYRKHPVLIQDTHPVNIYAVFKNIGLLLLILLLFISVVIAAHHVLALSFFMAIVITIIPFTLIWALVISKIKLYLRYSFLIWKKRTPNLNNVMLIFLPLGFFNTMITESSVIYSIQQPFILLSATPILLFIAIHLTCLLSSLIGIHPLVTLSLFGVIIHPLLTVINPVSLAIVLITAGLSTAAVGTFNTTVTIANSILRVNPFQLIRWNFLFGLMYGALGTLLAWLLL
jgi:hypothetical protein